MKGSMLVIRANNGTIRTVLKVIAIISLVAYWLSWRYLDKFAILILICSVFILTGIYILIIAFFEIVRVEVDQCHIRVFSRLKCYTVENNPNQINISKSNDQLNPYKLELYDLEQTGIRKKVKEFNLSFWVAKEPKLMDQLNLDSKFKSVKEKINRQNEK